MRRSLLVSGVMLAAVGLTACNNAERQRTDGSRFCTPFADAASANTAAAPGAATPVADPAAALDDCLHRWGYTLAAASDSADDVAQAAVAACTPALTRWNQQTLSAVGGAPGETAPSLLTGQQTTPLIEHYNYAQNRALFYVVQGRAGKCPPPPAEPAKK